MLQQNQAAIFVLLRVNLTGMIKYVAFGGDFLLARPFLLLFPLAFAFALVSQGRSLSVIGRLGLPLLLLAGMVSQLICVSSSAPATSQSVLLFIIGIPNGYFIARLRVRILARPNFSLNSRYLIPALKAQIA